MAASETRYFGEQVRANLLANQTSRTRLRTVAREVPGTWAHGDLHIGRITSDGAALITFAKAPGEVPVHPPETAGERLVEYLLRQNEAKAD